MAKVFTTENALYKKTLEFGPGFKFRYTMRLKSEEENIPYRKVNKLDVYHRLPDSNEEVIVGHCERFGWWKPLKRNWDCYVNINKIPITSGKMMDYLSFMQHFNNFLAIKKSGYEMGMLVTTGGKHYYQWYSTKTGYTIVDEIHQEIKEVATLLHEFVNTKETTETTGSTETTGTTGSTEQLKAEQLGQADQPE